MCAPGRAGADCGILCNVGSWSAGGMPNASTCTSCDEGWTTASNGSTSAADCSWCAANYGSYRAGETGATVYVQVSSGNAPGTGRPACPGAACVCKPCPAYFLRSFNATALDAMCYFAVPFAVTLEATSDSCNTTITDSISKALTDKITQVASSSDVISGRGLFVAPAATIAQTDCVAAVSAA